MPYRIKISETEVHCCFQLNKEDPATPWANQYCAHKALSPDDAVPIKASLKEKWDSV